MAKSQLPRVRCELGTVPLRPEEHVFYGGDHVVAGAGDDVVGTGAGEGKMAVYGPGEPWVGDEEVRFVVCEVAPEKTVIS